MENDTAAFAAAELIPTAPSPEADSETEQQLTDSINQLWSVHIQAQSIIKKTKGELAAIRNNLAERLHTMKTLLARPGRGGQWTSFLSQHGIPRTSADRLVTSHDKLLSADGNGTSGAIKELSCEEIDQAAKSVWSRLHTKLASHQAKYEFFSKLLIASGAPYETFGDGILILLDPPPAQEATAVALAAPDDLVPTAAHTESNPLPPADASLSGMSL
jgi:hypothetical protein